MIFFEYFAGVTNVEIIFTALLPGQLTEPIQVGLDHRIFGSLGGHLFHAAQLAQRLFFGLGTHLGRGDLFAVIFEFGFGLVAFAQLAADRFELLAQNIFTLRFFEAGLGLFADLRLHLGKGHPLTEEVTHNAQPFGHIKGVQQSQPLLGRILRRIGTVIRQMAGGANRAHKVEDAIGHARRQLDKGFDQPAHFQAELLGFFIPGLWIGARATGGAQIGIMLHHPSDFGAHDALHHQDIATTALHRLQLHNDTNLM